MRTTNEKAGIISTEINKPTSTKWKNKKGSMIHGGIEVVLARRHEPQQRDKTAEV